MSKSNEQSIRALRVTETRFPELAIVQLGAALWRYVARETASDAFDPYTGCIGPHFKTKAEALGALERYASFYGATGAEPYVVTAPAGNAAAEPVSARRMGIGHVLTEGHDFETCPQCIADAEQVRNAERVASIEVHPVVFLPGNEVEQLLPGSAVRPDAFAVYERRGSGELAHIADAGTAENAERIANALRRELAPAEPGQLWYVVIGRIEGDDEDSLGIYQAASSGEAERRLEAELRGERDDTNGSDFYLNFVINCGAHQPKTEVVNI